LAPSDRKLGRILFALPTLFTLSSLFCGFYSILQSATSLPGDTTALTRAALAIFFALFFDGLDGRVARLTRTQSAFGVQIDSLVDLVSFGAAPAVLVFRWALEPLGWIGVAVGFAFLACGALRLARFNLLADSDEGPKHHFVGLPIPAAAVLLALVVLVHQQDPGALVRNSAGVAVLVAVLAYLMVSNIRYRNFKHVRKVPLTLALAFSFIVTFTAVAVVTSFWFMALSMFSVYVVLGPAEELLFFRQRRAEEQDSQEEAS